MPAESRAGAPPPLRFDARPRPPAPRPRMPWWERLAIVACAVALAVGVILVLSGYFAGPDPAVVIGTAAQIGQSYPDQGDAALAPGAPRPHYDSNPPTSGPHHPRSVARQDADLSDDQLLSALAAGDVVIEYGTRRPPHGLRALARHLAGPFSAALAASGQAVILARRPGTSGLIGLAWTRTVSVTSPGDALLHQFIQAWLGHGAAR